jgi:RNA polymerase sigma-70 factor (ECF subfamily)
LEASEEDLVLAAAGGDDGAFHRLVDRHAPAMFRVAMSLSHNRSDAEDLLQETFIGAYRGMKRFAGRSSIRTWLLQILMRQAAKAWHRNRHHRQARSLSASEAGSESGETNLQGISTILARSNASATGLVETRLDVMEVLAKLSPAHRQILILREIEQMSYQEIAQVLDVPRGTVESRLSRARQEFRAIYVGM